MRCYDGIPGRLEHPKLQRQNECPAQCKGNHSTVCGFLPRIAAGEVVPVADNLTDAASVVRFSRVYYFGDSLSANRYPKKARSCGYF